MIKKYKKIVRYLLNINHERIESLTRHFDIESKEIANLVNDINTHFRKEAIIYNGEMIYIANEFTTLIAEYYQIPIDELTPIYKPEVRRDIAFLKIALNDDYLSLDDISQHCLASKNTLTNDIKAINSYISENDIYIEYQRKYGYLIKGKEINVRAEIMNVVDRMFQYPNGRSLLEEKVIMVKGEYFLLTERIRKLERKLNITLSDEYLNKLPYIILIMIKRSEVTEKEWELSIRFQDLSSTKEFKEIQDLFWGYPELTKQDLTYLALVFLGANRVDLKTESDIKSEIEIEKFVDYITMKLEEKLAFNFKNNQFKSKLTQHLIPALVRKNLKLTIENPVTDDFIQRYYPVYEVVKEIIDGYQDISLNEAEIVYLSMIVLGHMYYVNNEEYRNNKELKAVVVCHSGHSISELMKVQLKDMFSDVNYIGTYSMRQFYEAKPNVDIVFSTIPLKTNKKVFIMENLFSDPGRKAFIEKVETYFELDPNIKTRQLMNFLKDVIPEENFETIKDKAHTFFETEEEDFNNSLELLGEEQIKFVRDKDIFQMAAKGLNLLKNRNSINQNYLDSTMSIFEEKFETMIIGPGVYLPHAPVEDGAIKEDYQLLINPSLEKCVLCISPESNNAHVKKLLELNSLFTDELFMKRLYKSNEKELINLIEGSYECGIW
ncbi:BglG family transcription antiterminator [Salinicoccus halodurans]|uniref:Transcriptional antiterminator, BglG family n=1 Tax=Salinicoccus halodurans TaxID=407035 RepID=A0A0F7HIY2_9STAP|nr:PRD domain-containing protein [Salinicoccus halodurans]AKG73483.1 hypothetical protein AAT16_04185 [Salinicoccus halodurans]SFK51271.1 transcriptional antiterminator, BglG family [Salinicoccus halodurans]